jgi:hypothetical protein
MQPKTTYYFDYEIRGSLLPELKRGGFVFECSVTLPENLAQSILWPKVFQLEPKVGTVKYRNHEIREWPADDIMYQIIEVED